MIDLSARPAVRRGVVVLRVVLFLVVLAGGGMVIQYRTAEYTSLSRLYEDMREERVDVIEYSTETEADGGVHVAVLWSTGPFSWWQFRGAAGYWSQSDRRAFPETFSDQKKIIDFEKELRVVWGDQEIETGPFPSDRSDDRPWLKEIPWSPFALVVWVIGAGMLVLMLRTRDHRYANRWAWTWLFVSSPVGLLAYLCLEARLDRPTRATAPIGGFAGCLLCFPAGILFALAGSGFFWLVS